MHGEYKVPGGKLVVVDFDVVDGVIRNARVAGDFFLEPDEALGDIDGALEGLPAASDAKQIAARDHGRLRDGAVMLGFSAEAVAVAVRRALTDATSWSNYEWEIVHDPAVPPRLHLALDEVLATAWATGAASRTLRFWEWDESAVVIGSFQSVKNEVDPERRREVRVRRRAPHLGRRRDDDGARQRRDVLALRAVRARAGHELRRLYAFLDDWVLQGLRGIGIEATYQPLNDIASPLGKIGGAAQKRLGSAACCTTSRWRTTSTTRRCSRCCASAARRSATRASRRRRSASTRCGRRPDSAAGRSSRA
jgi:lipoate-protein ligase A